MAVGKAAYNLYFLTELHYRATFHLLGGRVAGVVNKLVAGTYTALIRRISTCCCM